MVDTPPSFADHPRVRMVYYKLYVPDDDASKTATSANTAEGDYSTLFSPESGVQQFMAEVTDKMRIAGFGVAKLNEIVTHLLDSMLYTAITVSSTKD